MKTISHSLFLIATTLIMMACDANYTSDYPNGPILNQDGYDTVDCSGFDIPANAITVRQALKIGKELGAGNTSEETYYIKGIVTDFHSKHESAMQGYGNAQFYIQDNLTFKAQFYAYQIYGINSAPFDSLSQIKVGDFVVIKSQITNFSGTVETTSRGSASLAFTTNDLAYPFKDYNYFEESFKDGLGNWTEQVKSGDVTTMWKAASSSSTTSAQVDSTQTSCESWLVSPTIALGTEHNQPVKLIFNHSFVSKSTQAQDRAGDYLRVKVKSNDGGWNDMPIQNFGTGKRVAYEKDTIDITPYANGSVQVAFAYKSDETFRSRWNVTGITISEYKRVKPTYK